MQANLWMWRNLSSIEAIATKVTLTIVVGDEEPNLESAEFTRAAADREKNLPDA